MYLFKRGLEKVPANEISIVEYDSQRRALKDHPVGARYRCLFGDEVTGWNEDLETYIDSLPGG